MSGSKRWGTLVAALSLAALGWAWADGEQRAAEREKLAGWQRYVGDWKGVGLPKRGSTVDSWQEESAWAWSFHDDHAKVVFQSTTGRYFAGGRIEPGAEKEAFVLRATPPGETKADDAAEVVYRGQLDAEGQAVFTIETPSAGRPDRISARLVANGDRLVILYEKRVGQTERYTRLAEVGYTRKGSGFGGGATYPECIVTGGLGDREVEYQGKKYKVCCEGCREMFEQNPEAALADYRARKEQEKRKKAQ